MSGKPAPRGLAGAFAVGTVLVCALAPRATGLDALPTLSNGPALEALRQSGDLGAQRAHAWTIVATLTHSVTTGSVEQPLFETWHGEAELFGTPTLDKPKPGIRGFDRIQVVSAPIDPAADVPVLTYTLYNESAYTHIVGNRLNEQATLRALLGAGLPDEAIAGDRTVPEFPTTAIVAKTVWWPVAKDGITALPVWDPTDNPPLSHGNPFTTWHRVVAVDPRGASGTATTPIVFVGTRYPTAHRVSLDAFFRVRVDADLARRIMSDPPSAKAMLIALGRPVAAGDYLILVSVNVATREMPQWIWVTFWWHDHPDEGLFAEGRPTSLTGAWHNYLMQAAFDTAKPIATDGGPHVAFNPWLEGRFPDGGQGPGIESNCLACHQRASYPTIAFLPVTRGDPELAKDRAFAPGRLRTSFLWSLTMHAKP